MLLHKELAYEAPPEAVFEMLADPAFRARVCEAQEVVSHDITLVRTAEGFTLVNDEVQRTEGLPAIATKFTGDTTHAIHRETWTSHTAGEMTLETPGKPGGATGTLTLQPAGAATVQVVHLDVRVRVPLIGGRLEGLMAGVIERSYDVEHAVGVAWLAGER
jgi:hypothetical protein